jgi:predicted nucleotide-binding protein
MIPVMGSSEDVNKVVDYLKTKATGVTLAEAKATIDSQHLDHRKLSAYVLWGLIKEAGGRLELTEFGRQFGRASKETRTELFGEIIRNVRAYRIAVEWIFHSKFDVIAAVDLAAHWLSHIPDELETKSESTVRDQSIVFFKMAQGAGLGNYILGRGKQATRLEINHEPLTQFIAQLGLGTLTRADAPETEIKEAKTAEADPEVIPPEQTAISKDEKLMTDESFRVFITHSKNEKILDQVKTMLDLAHLDYEVAVDEETTAIPVPEKVFSAMRRAQAAVICVTCDDEMKARDNNYSVNQNVLIEIGAAFVLYDRRVVLVWDKRIPIPSNLQGLYRCPFEGDELSWSEGMKLMKALDKFQG